MLVYVSVSSMGGGKRPSMFGFQACSLKSVILENASKLVNVRLNAFWKAYQFESALARASVTDRVCASSSRVVRNVTFVRNSG